MPGTLLVVYCRVESGLSSPVRWLQTRAASLESPRCGLSNCMWTGDLQNLGAELSSAGASRASPAATPEQVSRPEWRLSGFSGALCRSPTREPDRTRAGEPHSPILGNSKPQHPYLITGWQRFTQSLATSKMILLHLSKRVGRQMYVHGLAQTSSMHTHRDTGVHRRVG